MFLIYGGDKELVVNGYIDASFDIDPDDSKSQTRYVFYRMVELSVGAVLRKASWRNLCAKWNIWLLRKQQTKEFG